MAPRSSILHSLIISGLIFTFIGLLNVVRLNLHYLDPFNNGLKNYEITDIIWGGLDQTNDFFDDNIIIVDAGRPDRARIARLVNKLDSAGASVIGLDIYFEKFNGKPEDTLLRNAIRQSDKVVLACLVEDANLQDDFLEDIGGVHPFFGRHAPWGYGNFPSNATKTIRIVSPTETIRDSVFPAFSTAVLQKYRPRVAANYLARGHEVEHIYFQGHKNAYISSNINRILDSMSLTALRETVLDRIVLVGYAPEDPWSNPLLDRHYTPLNQDYSNRSIPDMFGIVVHANVLSMALGQQFIYNVPWWLALFISCMICLANVLLFRWIYRRFHEAFHGITRAIQLLEFLLLFFIITLLFYFFRVKIDLRFGILSVLLSYDFIMIYESLILPRLTPRSAIKENTKG